VNFTIPPQPFSGNRIKCGSGRTKRRWNRGSVSRRPGAHPPHGIPIREVVNFGSPRTGDGDFKAGYEAALRRTRYENYGDVIALAPPSHAPVDLLVDILGRIPGAGPEIAGWFQAAKAWNYHSVDVPRFIGSLTAGYGILTDEPARIAGAGCSRSDRPQSARPAFYLHERCPYDRLRFWLHARDLSLRRWGRGLV
jgi:hypothetical protein